MLDHRKRETIATSDISNAIKDVMLKHNKFLKDIREGNTKTIIDNNYISTLSWIHSVLKKEN